MVRAKNRTSLPQKTQTADGSDGNGLHGRSGCVSMVSRPGRRPGSNSLLNYSITSSTEYLRLEYYIQHCNSMQAIPIVAIESIEEM